MPEAPQTTLMPACDVGHRQGADGEAGALAVDDQAAVHLGVLHRAPSGRRPGRGSPGWCWSRSRRGRRRRCSAIATVGLAGVDLVDAVDLQPHQDPLEGLLALGGDVDAGVRRVVRPVPDVELLDAVVAAVLADVVEHLGQGRRVDQVAPDLDDLVVRSRAALPCSCGRAALEHRPVVVVVAGARTHRGDQVDEPADEPDHEYQTQPGRQVEARHQATPARRSAPRTDPARRAAAAASGRGSGGGGGGTKCSSARPARRLGLLLGETPAR